MTANSLRRRIPSASLLLVTAVALTAASCSTDTPRVLSPAVMAAGGSAAAVKGGDPAGDAGRSLVLSVAPGGAAPGSAFSTQPAVEFRSAKGQLLPVDERVSGRLIGTNTPLGGTTTVRAAGGVASFSDLSIAAAGTYTLEFSAPGANSVRATIVVGGVVACPITLSPSSATYSSTSATGRTVAVTSSGPNCAWTVSGAPFWITSVTGGGIGSGTVTYNVLPNDASSQVRSATLTIGDRPFTITQAGAPCTFSMMLNDGGAGMVTDGHTATISAAGGTYTLNVTTAPADCAWTPVSNSSWITLADGSPRVGDAVVTYSVAPLAHTALARSGKISLTVASGSLGVLSVTISQIH